MVQTIDKAIKKLTFAEYLIYENPSKSDIRYELHRGILIEMATPTAKHTRIAEYVRGQLVRHLVEQKLPLVAVSNIGVRTEENSSRIPDVVVCSRSSEEMLCSQGKGVLDLDESPVLVVEVTSENWRTDYREKKAEYGGVKIAEYWIIDPDQQRIRVYKNPDEEGNYQYEDYLLGQRVLSEQLPDFELDVSEALSPPQEYEIIRGEREVAEAKNQRERQRAEAADQRAEAERQRAEAERQRAEAERQRAEAEHQRAEAADQRAEAERQRVAKLEAKLRELGLSFDDL